MTTCTALSTAPFTKCLRLTFEKWKEFPPSLRLSTPTPSPLHYCNFPRLTTRIANADADRVAAGESSLGDLGQAPSCILPMQRKQFFWKSVENCALEINPSTQINVKRCQATPFASQLSGRNFRNAARSKIKVGKLQSRPNWYPFEIGKGNEIKCCSIILLSYELY